MVKPLISRTGSENTHSVAYYPGIITEAIGGQVSKAGMFTLGWDMITSGKWLLTIGL
jgi:hypothetical protein